MARSHGQVSQEPNYPIIGTFWRQLIVKKDDVKKEKRDPPFSHAVVKKVADTKASGGSDLSYVIKKEYGQCE